ncbi:MAG: DUF3098 domain-containing protein [Candidatus Cryptobacteroides sp.]
MDNVNPNMPVTRKGLLIIAAGVVIMFVGYILMIGGGSSDPKVFNPAMFDFRRITLAPIVIIAGIAVVIAGIMNRDKSEKKQ